MKWLAVPIGAGGSRDPLPVGPAPSAATAVHVIGVSPSVDVGNDEINIVTG